MASRRARRAARYIPLAAALLGMWLVLLGVFYFFTVDDGRRLVTVALGLLLLLAAVWFAANPFFKDSRRFVLLRQEVEHFNTFLPELHRAGLEPRDEERIAKLTEQMHRAVDRMARKAGRSPDEQPPNGTRKAPMLSADEAAKPAR